MKICKHALVRIVFVLIYHFKSCKDIREGIIAWVGKLFELVLSNWVATNQKIEELKQNQDNPDNAQNLKIAQDNPLLTALAQRSLLNGYRNMAGNPGNGQKL